MNPLLKKQLIDFFGENYEDNSDLLPFFNTIENTYTSYDEQIVTVQQAMSSSSELIEHINKQTKDIIDMNSQREALLASLRIQNEELSDYAHMVSHDLKSPLRNIDTLTSWLKEDYESKLDDKGKQTIKLIRNNVQKMEDLVVGILEYSTINKGDANTYDVKVASVLDDVLKTVSIPENIKVNVKDNLPTIKADKSRVHQLFQNLINNAVAFNDKENGNIEIGHQELDDVWQFYVKDNGIGIDKVYFNKIFKTFERLDNTSTSAGIGLSIVKKIVDYYEGKVWLESTINEGTTFFFTIKKK
ncbi:sensor histidine kinase [Postechiella marina]